jgi:ATP-dependent Clp protease ATP-binding subunit ClpA
MGARPMARVIQEHIKKPLADEVLFGKLKNGGHVRVVVIKDADDPDGAHEESGQDKLEDKLEDKPGDKLGFEFLEGPVIPKPEKIPPVRPKAKRRGGGTGGGGGKRPKPPGPSGNGGAASPSRGSVPKIPLVRV